MLRLLLIYAVAATYMITRDVVTSYYAYVYAAIDAYAAIAIDTLHAAILLYTLL